MNNPFVSLELWGGLFGGLALFLFGMDIMTKALKLVAGDHMKDLLARFTRNRFVGAGMGAMITAIIQWRGWMYAMWSLYCPTARAQRAYRPR